ncbi:MAG: DUF2591 domain-containing protein [Pseudomonadota bacterium]|nr:DUF2591 domain-containing protein [Pseudomonadota bacterium]
MAKHTISGLTGTLLDLAVAKCEGRSYELRFKGNIGEGWFETDVHGVGNPMPRPSQDWTAAGPIIEREHLYFTPNPHEWTGYVLHNGVLFQARGDTGPVAMMRAYVTSRFGETIDLT